MVQHQSRGHGAGCCPSKSCLAVVEGSRMARQREMRLARSGILLQAPGTASHFPLKAHAAWDPEECAQLWERGVLGTEEEE